MAIDRGGLDYSIVVRDKFGKPLDQFVAKIDRARASYERFKASTADPAGSAGVVKLQRTSEQTQRSMEALTRRATRLAEETAQVTRQEDNRRRALEKLNREARKREIAERAAIASSRREFQNQRQLATATRARVVTEERITRLLDRRTANEQALRVVQERGLQTDRKLRQELGLLTTAERRQIRAQQERRRGVDALRRAQREASNERLRQIRAETQALNILNRAQITEARNEILRARGRADLIPGARRTTAAAVEDPRQTVTLFSRLRDTLFQTDNQANRVAFTFRRLFGILAAFTLARQAVNGFVNSVRALVDASAQIETSTLGIASILVSVADIRDASGEAVDAVQGLAIAQGEARRQTQLLRRDALATTATFEELVEAFQVGLAPGLRSGLDVDQIRVFTRQISLAATAIGLEQRQLAEEIRSILGGTINVRNTRIAAALGITNAEIRQARQTGTLFEFLQERFAGFDAAGAQAADTFSGLVGRVRDGFRLLLAEGGVDFFEEIKNTLRDSLSAIQTLNRTSGEIELNPTFLTVVNLITEGLREAVAQFREFTRGLSEEAIVNFATAIGDAFSAAARVTRVIVESVVQGLRAVGATLTIVRRVTSAIGRAFQISPASFQTILDVLIRIAVIFTAINAAVFVLGLSIKVVAFSASTVLTTLQAAAKVLVVIRTLVTAINVLAIANPIGAAIVFLIAALTFLTFRLGLLDSALESVGGTAERIFGRVEKAVSQIVDRSVNEAGQAFSGFVNSTSKALDEIQDKIEEIYKTILNLREETDIQLLFTAEFNFDSPFIRIAEELRKARAAEAESRREAAREAEAAFDEFFKLQQQAGRNARELAAAGFGSPDVAEARRLLEIERDRADQLRGIESTIQNLRDSLNRPLEITGLDALTGRVDRRAFQEQEEIRRAQTASLIEQLQAKRDLLAIDGFRAQRNEQILNEFLQLQAQIRIAEERGARATEAQVALQGALLSQAIARARVEAQAANNALREENARARAASLESRSLAIAEVSRDLAAQRLILARQAVSVAAFEADFEVQAIEASREKNDAAISLVQTEIARLHALEESGDLVDSQAIALQQALEFEKQLLEGRRLLNDQLDLTKMKLEDQRLVLEEQLRLQEFAQINPIGAAFVDGLAEAFSQASDLFTNFRQIFISGVNEFSSLISSSIVDAFDPGADTSIRERFRSFLNNLADQIIQTLLQIAITAAILNALSGGILGATIGGFASNALGRGFNEGGPVTDRDRPTARGRRGLSHARARGYARGGVPNRPKNLHPSDKIPIWAAANEWVIRAKSAAKAGWDAMSVINNGNFEAPLLRAALGLSSSPVPGAAVSASRGPGFVDGGRIAPAAGSRPAAPSAPSVAAAVIAPSNEAFSRLLEGGADAMLEFFSSFPEEIRARLGV